MVPGRHLHHTFCEPSPLFVNALYKRKIVTLALAPSAGGGCFRLSRHIADYAYLSGANGTADMVCKILSRRFGNYSLDESFPGLSDKRAAFCTKHDVEVFPEHWSQRQLFLCEQERITRNLKRTLPAFYKRNFLSNPQRYSVQHNCTLSLC